MNIVAMSLIEIMAEHICDLWWLQILVLSFFLKWHAWDVYKET